MNNTIWYHQNVKKYKHDLPYKLLHSGLLPLSLHSTSRKLMINILAASWRANKGMLFHWISVNPLCLDMCIYPLPTVNIPSLLLAAWWTFGSVISGRGPLGQARTSFYHWDHFWVCKAHPCPLNFIFPIVCLEGTPWRHGWPVPTWWQTPASPSLVLTP